MHGGLVLSTLDERGSDRSERWLTRKHRGDIPNGEIGHRRPRLDGAASNVRQQHHVFERQQLRLDQRLILEYVKPGARDQPHAQCPGKCFFVDDRTAPEACQTMAEVRVGVDALDRALVTLLAERQRYMDAAARIKPVRDAVHDEPRIEQVVTNVKAAATDAGLSHDIAEPVWRLLIDRCIAHEFGEFDKSRA